MFELSVDADTLQVGKVIPCKIVERTEQNDYLVDLGIAEQGLLPAQEVMLEPNSTATNGSSEVAGQGWAELGPGQVYEAQIMSMTPSISVSIAQVSRGLAWRRAEQLFGADITYLSTVLKTGKAGVIVNVEQLPAFLPWSHWHLPNFAPSKRRTLVGKTLPVKFLEVDRARNRLIVSHRRFQLQNRLDQLRPGMLVDGTIESIRPYGAVVTIADGLDGLLHISQVSKTYVKEIKEVLAPGTSIRCVVIRIDMKEGTVNLSTKMLESKPGEMVRDKKAVFERAMTLEAVTLDAVEMAGGEVAEKLEVPTGADLS